MKVKNMTSSKGNKIANQFILRDKWGNEFFQSYDSIIVKLPNPNNQAQGKLREIFPPEKTQLDINDWDYSVTTGKYRNLFLGETKAETQAKIDSGEYELVNLN